jgi:hypothetical protein
VVIQNAPAPAAVSPAAVAATAEAAAGVAGAAPPISAAADARCKAVAGQRKSDAAVNGYDDGMQQQIFDGTYKNCMDWAARHP